MGVRVVYRTPGESTTRYLVQVEKQLKMVHHYFFSSSDSSNPDVLYALDSGKILVSIYAFFLGNFPKCTQELEC